MNNLEEAKENFYLIDNNLTSFATKSSEAKRIILEENDYRTPFSRDSDRIMHALSYTRYSDKTQVYSFKENDHISKRMVHVQFVSRISRTIARALCLNTDLVEAIALGHDIGHTPLGHFGESVLNEISKKELNEYFSHNIQSVRHYMYIENNGKGLNLSVQVLDGIMCHNGEMLDNIYEPVKKDTEEVLKEYIISYKDIEKSRSYKPMTLEGCVVRISDIIAYVGRDVEDSINLGLFKREDIPQEITKVLGNTNKEIINTLTTDIINESINKPYIKMSDEVFDALNKLKDFNYKNIYNKAMSSSEKNYYRENINKLYNHYLRALKNNDQKNIIYSIFLNTQTNEYINNTKDERKVLDFIAGMTDELLSNQISKIL